ncbi:hypothetical protein, partial [Mesomycoplasma ovipneumoniae]|uniref:hypothetical protein n=1 Tax=Mesomycoplasma ovipneumoniae TaxID=29562 RepID=UPI003080A3B2
RGVLLIKTAKISFFFIQTPLDFFAKKRSFSQRILITNFSSLQMCGLIKLVTGLDIHIVS